MPSITIKGVDKLQAKLKSAEDVNRVLRSPMQRSVLRLQRDIAEYPAPPARSTYRRTGTYGRGWSTKVNASSAGLRGIVGTNVPYAPFVGSSMFQARWNRHWPTDESVASDNENAIVRDFERAIQAELDS